MSTTDSFATTIRVVLAASTFAIFAIVPATAHATGSNDFAAVAQALFYEARTLMSEHRYAEACAKLEESLRLDYGVETEFNLAECHARAGKSASAWAGFLRVAATAKQTEREKLARERAGALEPKLAKLVIDVPTPLAGLEVRRDGVVLASASWGAAIPIDPGAHRIVATAPNKQAWETTVHTREAATARVTIPTDLPDLIATSAAPMTPSEPPPAGALSPSTTTRVEPTPPSSASMRETMGYTLGAVGLAGTAIGGVFAIDSLASRNAVNDHCTGKVCDPEGLALRDRAVESGNVATVALIGGGLAVAGGIALVLTASSAEQKKRGNTVKNAAFRAIPNVGMNGGGLTLAGALP